ncbi:uncharacterized protein MONBRDRAFT_29850 [Monosiga brevicollis MX1]|uniref:Aquaporin n=1 Tax=Monosiga brevicollis TaxID=81824 RepID=A9VCA9_MONBE|nr:uncharacterized protein MONBRDRAFT_29850 [Monosiga brevicollis MX1]EDQ84827.1 predicted protein [Monosiga brevicollis MX1]|eukprot:XP_001750328.1 hypothetical protein [Monosiga brevicollis MX1]
MGKTAHLWPYLGWAELFSLRTWRASLAECLVTFLFVFVSCGAVVATGMVEDAAMDASRLLTIAMAHGLGIAVLAASTSAISGGHINPAVSFAFALTGTISIVRFVLYTLFQLLGAVLGAALLYAAVPPAVRGNLGAHTLGPDVSAAQGFLIEVMLTFVLMFVIFANAADPKGNGTLAPLLIGLTVVVDICIGAPLTGASMNPARSFGPALVMNTAWKHHIIYWFGPLLGAGFAAVWYRHMFFNPKQKEGSEGGGLDEITPSRLLVEIKSLLSDHGNARNYEVNNEHQPLLDH